MLTVLLVLEMFGMPDAIPAVKELAQRSATTERRQSLQAAAQNCLEALQIREAKAKQAQTLLRASTAPIMPDLLLRPAMPEEASGQREELLSQKSDSKCVRDRESGSEGDTYGRKNEGHAT